MANQGVVFIRGPRITLRPVLREDVPFFMRWMNDPEVNRFLAMYLPVMETDEEEWVANLAKSKQNNIVLVLMHDDRPIGTMGLHNISWKDRTAVTGAVIGEKEYWGKGLGTEAKMLLLEYAFNSLNLRKICSSAIEFNGRSLGFNAKCGYKEEGRRKKQIYKDGRYWDEVLTAVFREDWLSLWEEWKKSRAHS